MSTFPIQCPCRMKHHVRKNNLESDCRALNSRNLFVLAHCLLFSFTYVLLLLWTATLVTFIYIYMHLLDHCAEDLPQAVLTQPCLLCIFRSYVIGPGSSCIIVGRFCNRFNLFTVKSLLLTSIRTY